ncbi:hypothetical protein GCM10023321_61440 [Pseudonocardia eucalypti]|uniref:Cell division protein FtsL n=1 Tax=Pseudonocardia eucalypti TaxID=648755 RepID=A0ABP9QV66_9PSEU
MGKAYARRARRLGVDGGADRAAAGRSRFVLLVMVLLGSGLVASLWLSTTAAADSYRLDKARLAARELSERSEQLRMDITSMESAPALARSARQLGMVPASDVARLVARPDGSVQVVGTPKAAVAPAPPPAPAQPAPAVPSQHTATQNPPTQNAPSQAGAGTGAEPGVSAP